jgi:hypothetical protein
LPEIDGTSIMSRPRGFGFGFGFGRMRSIAASDHGRAASPGGPSLNPEHFDPAIE